MEPLDLQFPGKPLIQSCTCIYVFFFGFRTSAGNHKVLSRAPRALWTIVGLVACVLYVYFCAYGHLHPIRCLPLHQLSPLETRGLFSDSETVSGL